MLKQSIVMMIANFAAIHAHAGGSWQTLLDVDFDDQPLDTPIGTGGAVLGQPVDINPSLSAIVRQGGFPTPNLQVGQSDEGAARYLRFHFLDDAEPKRGQLIIEVDLMPSKLDHYVVSLREHTSSADVFGQVVLQPDGRIWPGDANGSVNLAAYTPDTILQIRWIHDLDTGTYDLYLGDVQVFDDREHGVDLTPPTADGIGAVLAGLGSSSSAAATFRLDNLFVDWLPPDIIFSGGFEMTGD